MNETIALLPNIPWAYGESLKGQMKETAKQEKDWPQIERSKRSIRVLGKLDTGIWKVGRREEGLSEQFVTITELLIGSMTNPMFPAPLLGVFPPTPILCTTNGNYLDKHCRFLNMQIGNVPKAQRYRSKHGHRIITYS